MGPICCLRREPKQDELFPDVLSNNDRENNFNDDKMDESLRQKLDATVVNVIKFVDHSNKYGMGYILSNGFTGVLFNDFSAMTLAPNKRNFYHMDSSGEVLIYGFKNFQNGKIDDKSLKKRFTIFIAISKSMWQRVPFKNAPRCDNYTNTAPE